MKVSKYTFLFDITNQEFYVYNTLSNVLIEIDEESYSILSKAQKDRSDIVYSSIDTELYDLLILKRIIVENDLDSYLYYKSILCTQRADQSYMHLTIAPTMDCSFNCHYCFEKYKTKNYMTEDTMNRIIKYLNSLSNKPDLKLTWFGGEPLMALFQMEEFYKKLKDGYKVPLISNIITTGYHLNADAVKVLRNIGIKQVQITLDGLKDTHNAVKKTSDCSDVFNKVLNNVEMLLASSDIHVVFRVNLTKKNKHEYVQLYYLLKEKFNRYKHKGIAPAFVMDRGCSKTNLENKSLFFVSHEIAPFVLDLYYKNKIHSPFLRYPSRFFTECAIRNKMSISFDPEGYAYKCWEIIGNKDYAIGQINEEGLLENINEIVLNRHLYGADPMEDPICSVCRYLPICNGGCPIQRIENLFDGKKNCCCTFWKGSLVELLKIHLSLKKNGFNNNAD